MSHSLILLTLNSIIIIIQAALIYIVLAKLKILDNRYSNLLNLFNVKFESYSSDLKQTINKSNNELKFMSRNIEQKISSSHSILKQLDRNIEQRINASNKKLEERIIKNLNKTNSDLLKNIEYYFSNPFKFKQAEDWLEIASSQTDKGEMIRLLEVGCDKFPFSGKLHIALYNILNKELLEERPIIEKKAILDTLIPLFKNYSKMAPNDEMLNAQKLYRNLEEHAIKLLNQLEEFRTEVTEEKLKVLGDHINQLRNLKSNQTKFNDVADKFKEIFTSIDIKFLKKGEQSYNRYKSLSDEFSTLLKTRTKQEHNLKVQQHTKQKLQELKQVSAYLVNLSKNKEPKVKDTEITRYAPLLVIKKPEMLNDKATVFANSLYSRFFSLLSLDQQQSLTNMMVKLENE